MLTLYHVSYHVFARIYGVSENILSNIAIFRYIYSNAALTSFGSAFRNLRVVQGTLTFSYHRQTTFTSLAGAFPSLTNVTGNLYLQYNDYVTTLNSAFPRLRWVNGLLYL